MITPKGPTVVLVHGAWADGSSWNRVVPLLMRRGIPVLAVQNPTTSLAADVAATRRMLDTIDGPVVLVGHSWGGAVITEAGTDAKVKGLVFVAALPPDVGQSVGDLVGSHPAPPALDRIEDEGEFLRMGLDGWVHDVAHDLPEEEARVLAAVQPPLAKATFGDRITQAAWRDRPNWFIVSTQDRAVSIDLQLELAAKMKATVVELPASHVSLLSMPQAVADVIAEAVESVAMKNPVAA